MPYKKQKFCNTPSIILIEPQLGENIGMAARAMLNCGVMDLRIVSPRDGWPNKDAIAAAAGATTVIKNAQIFKTTINAIADLDVIFASTARPRDMEKRITDPKEAAIEMIEHIRNGTRIGIIFGQESKGLKNNDVALADAVLYLPLNPEFNSLNLAQAVFAICYEWHKVKNGSMISNVSPKKKSSRASKIHQFYMFEHLETELDRHGFFRVIEKRPSMVRNIRNMLGRAEFSEQEIRTFRGIIKALASTEIKDK